VATDRIRPRAALFDLDGTLVDSEINTDHAITEVMARHGVPGVVLPAVETRGRTWADISRTLIDRHHLDVTIDVLRHELLTEWRELASGVEEIPGAGAAVRAAARHLGVGVVSSSPRSVIDAFLAQLGVDAALTGDARIGEESVTRSKPDPEGYLLCARRLGVDPAACIVFEDSRAGLEAARAAGMRTVFVLHRAADIEKNRVLADASISNYHALPERFWEEVASGALDLEGRSFQ
jgi:mannitol-1-/sugar-/sorbitol-6-phosphatase